MLRMGQGSTLPETNSLHLKSMVGILISFWDGLFSGAMLVLGSVRHLSKISLYTLYGTYNIYVYMTSISFLLFLPGFFGCFVGKT